MIKEDKMSEELSYEKAQKAVDEKKTAFEKFQKATEVRLLGLAGMWAEEAAYKEGRYTETIDFIAEYNLRGDALKIAFHYRDLSKINEYYFTLDDLVFERTGGGKKCIPFYANINNVLIALQIARFVGDKTKEKEIYTFAIESLSSTNIRNINREYILGREDSLKSLVKAVKLADFEGDAETKERINQIALEVVNSSILNYNEEIRNLNEEIKKWKQNLEVIRREGVSENLEKLVSGKK